MAAEVEGTVTDILSVEQFEKMVTSSKNTVIVFFYTDWSFTCTTLYDHYKLLPKTTPGVDFCKVNAEALSEIAEQFSVSKVPLSIIFRGGAEVRRVKGADISHLEEALETESSQAGGKETTAKRPPPSKPSHHHETAPVLPSGKHQQMLELPPNTAAQEKDLNERLKCLVTAGRLVLFMKGNAETPACGFSRQIVEILKNEGASFYTFDILKDGDVRQGLKTFSNWPTFPQLYLDGELLGGLDTVKAMKDEGELVLPTELLHNN